MPDRAADRATTSWGKWALAVCVLLGLALRGIEAHEKSLWLDEYHTLHLADSATLGEIVDKGASDLHPPAFFWALSLFRGVAPHAQRWLPILLSLLTLLPLGSIARGLGEPARLSLFGVFLFAPYSIQYGAELRSYSALELVAVLLAWAAVTARARPWVRIGAFALATAVGLYVHYFVAVAVLSVGLVRCVSRPPGAISLRALVAAGAVGALFFLPWVQGQEDWVLRDPGEVLEWSAVPEPALASVWAHNLQKAAVVPVQTLVPMIGGLGAPWAGAMRIATILLLAASAVGGLCILWRIAKRTTPAAPPEAWSGAWSAAGVGVVAFLATTVLCLVVWKRVPLQYFAVAAWAWPLGIALGVQCVPGAKLARLLTALVLFSGLMAGTCHVLGASREDTEAGVAAAVRAGAGRDAIYTAVLWQPDWYPHTLPFRYRGVHEADLDVREPGEIPAGDAPGGERPVIVVTRKTDPERFALRALWAPILRGRRLVETIPVDEATRVYVFER